MAAGKTINVPTFTFTGLGSYSGNMIAGYTEVPAHVVLHLEGGRDIRIEGKAPMNEFRRQSSALKNWLGSALARARTHVAEIARPAAA